MGTDTTNRVGDWPKFSLGSTAVTRGVLASLSDVDIGVAITRHGAGDWGNLNQHDINVNEQALRHGGRLFSAYASDAGIRFYVITEADRSVTTVLLPSEY